MIQVKVDRNGIEFHAGDGNLVTLTAQMCQIVNALYSRLKCSAEPGLGDDFRNAMIAAVITPGSPVWEVHPGGEGSMSIVAPMHRRDES